MDLLPTITAASLRVVALVQILAVGPYGNPCSPVQHQFVYGLIDRIYFRGCKHSSFGSKFATFVVKDKLELHNEFTSSRHVSNCSEDALGI
jgi:hypothetical protein